MQVGWFRDGFPIYGRCNDADDNELLSCYDLTGADGDNMSDYTYTNDADCQLDAANGYTFPDGSYGYLTTSNLPYVPPYYAGDGLASICGFTP